jgi:sugar phosphate isomerase/epimerase
MKIGVMSAAFPNTSLEDLATWASDSGFEMLELACWPAGEARDRRYGGVVLSVRSQGGADQRYAV